MPIHPRPRAETTGPLRPNLRVFMVKLLQTRVKQTSCCHRAEARPAVSKIDAKAAKRGSVNVRGKESPVQLFGLTGHDLGPPHHLSALPAHRKFFTSMM